MVRTSARGLAGLHPASADIRQRTGCSVVAVERHDEVMVDFSTDFRIHEGDTLFVCGSNEATRQF